MQADHGGQAAALGMGRTNQKRGNDLAVERLPGEVLDDQAVLGLDGGDADIDGRGFQGNLQQVREGLADDRGEGRWLGRGGGGQGHGEQQRAKHGD